MDDREQKQREEQDGLARDLAALDLKVELVKSLARRALKLLASLRKLVEYTEWQRVRIMVKTLSVEAQITLEKEKHTRIQKTIAQLDEECDCD